MIKNDVVYADFRRQRVFYFVIVVAVMIVFVYILDRRSVVFYALEAAFLILAFVQIYLHLRGQRNDIFMQKKNGAISIYKPTLTGSREISVNPNEVTGVAERNFGSVVSFKVYLASGDILTISPERLLWMSYGKEVREDSRNFLRGIFRERYRKDWSWP